MLLPTKMKRIEIIVHRDQYESAMGYLRETRVLELLDVKDMLNGYEGAVAPCSPSERLYRLVALGSKINNLTNALRLSPNPAAPVEATSSLTDQQITEIENRAMSLEKEVATLSTEIQTCEKTMQFADEGLRASLKEIMKITNVNTPEGRHRLEEIMLRIFDALPMPEIEQSGEGPRAGERMRLSELVRRAIADEIAQALAAHKDDAAVLAILNQALGLKILDGSTTSNLKFDLESPVQRARDQATKFKLKLQEAGLRNVGWLQVNGELVNAERVLEEAKGLCGKTKSTYVIEGWLPANRIAEVQADLNKITRGRSVIQEWSGKNSPTMLRNPRGTGAFQRLTMGFGTPASNEIDPTVLWIITYPLFFGLMFGDVGHGLIVMLVSMGLMYAKRKGIRFEEQSFGGLGGLFSMILEGSGLLVLGGAAATVCGFLYGTVMGSEEWFTELTGLAHPLWFNPFEHPMTLLKISIIIGVIHVSSGLVLDILNKAKNRDYVDMLVGPGLWLWFYLTLGYLILSHGFRLISYALSNFQVVLLLLGLPSGLMLIAKLRMEGPFEGVGHWIESMLASISHTISYLRIMAMKMIHDVFSILFLGILVSMPVYLGVPIFSLLTLLMILILEAAFVFLQALRLHWVEWFLKFYSGSGMPFKPFGIQRTYTRVTMVT